VSASEKTLKRFRHPRRRIVALTRLTTKAVTYSRWHVTLDCGHVIANHLTWSGRRAPRSVHCLVCPAVKTNVAAERLTR
jgi:hypothetical protein